MLTINILLKEIKEIPLSKLDEVYQFIRTLNRKPAKSNKVKSKIMSYAGIFNDMSDDDFNEFVAETQRRRK